MFRFLPPLPLMHSKVSLPFLLLAFLIPPGQMHGQFFWPWRKEAVVNLRPDEAKKIGERIWRNECDGTVEGLTSWNRGENFASLGIGHFIWYPVGVDGPFDESWPKLLNFLRSREVNVPSWLLQERNCPWHNYEEFQAAREGPEMRDLRTLLSRTVAQQTEFIIQRLRSALPKIMGSSAVPRSSRKLVETRFEALAGTSQGLYAMADYVNFKGEGTKSEERYHGHGWGLAQVLMEMRGYPRGPMAAWEFSEAAKRVLLRRVQNAPKDESQWLDGWQNRCDTYKAPL